MSDGFGADKISAVPLNLQVRIWGTDQRGKPFWEAAQAVEVWFTGARLAGTQSTLENGEIIGLQAGHKKGRFRVVSVAQSGQVELQGIQIGENFWPVSLSQLSAAPAAPQAETTVERRKQKRYTIVGTAAVRTEESIAAHETVLTDISGGGCYVQTTTPFPLNATLGLDITLVGYSFQLSGVVCTIDQVGMGIQFTGEPQPKLAELLSELEAGRVFATTRAPVIEANAPDADNRLQSVAEELGDLGQLIQCTELEPEGLRQYRNALGDLRSTALRIERYLELQAGGATAVPQLDFLTSEQIRLATRLCRALAQSSGTLNVDSHQLEELLAAVRDLVQSAIRGYPPV